VARFRLDEAARVGRPLGQDPTQGSEVIGQKGLAHSLQGGAGQIGLGQQAVLLLEIQNRRAHGRVVLARLVLGHVHQTLASKAFLHFGKGGALGLHPQVGLHLAGAARISSRQLL
jgi:hypothetical protein